MSLVSEYRLTIYADDEGAIDPERVNGLIRDARALGGDTAPLEYVEPIHGGDPQPWGLTIRIIEESE